MNIPAVCSIVVCAIASICLGFFVLVGVVTCRAEGEFWSEFWAETPITEGASSAVRVRTAEAFEDQFLKRAA